MIKFRTNKIKKLKLTEISLRFIMSKLTKIKYFWSYKNIKIL